MATESLTRGLWPHQRYAVSQMAGYLDANSHPCDVAALVSMPTGTGKTAVMAAIIDRARPDGHWLVLVPRRSLATQLRRALDHAVWSQLGIARPQRFAQIRKLPTSGRIDELAEVSTATVFIDTIQKLVKIDAKLGDDTARRAQAFAGFQGVLIDEGHYEPSPTWSEAVRSLRLPAVLFTATPYRNDELHFLIDADHRYTYHHHQAVADGRLRQPRFVTVADGSTTQFIDDTVEFVARKRLHAARVIIRCASPQAIRECVDLLRRGGHTAIGVHHTFGGSGHHHLVAEVPAPTDTDAQYWVHQYMLAEGIDDPAFRVVAFHGAMNNDRAVIQQIGRALRRPTPGPKTAWVISRQGSDVSRVWERYLHFDRHGGTSTATAPTFTQCLLEAQPAAVYYDRQFRAPIELGDPQLWTQLAYQPAAYILRVPPDQTISPAELAADIVAEYDTMGLAVQPPMYPDAVTVVIGYVHIANSDALLDGLFLEGTLGSTVIRVLGGRVFVFDTHKLLAKAIRTRVRPEPRVTLSKLLDAGTRITKVSLDNTDISRQAPRRRTTSAASINDIAPGLTDYAFVCNLAEGYTSRSALGADTMRYLGLTRARVRDGRRVRLTFHQFRGWVDEVNALLDDTAITPTHTLGRYADAVDPPAEPAPRHVLVDVDPGDYLRVDDAGIPHCLELDWLASHVTDNHTTVTVGQRSVGVSLEWDTAAARYRFASPALRAMGFRNNAGEGDELTAVINTEQLLRVVPTSPGSVYVHGQFIAVPDPHTHRAGRRLLDRIVAVPALEDAREEKGKPVDNGWPARSVFGVIDKMATPARSDIPEMSRYFEHLDTLVCTDMGTEPCDFIAMQPDRIAFIHAKHGRGAQRSATVFQEVVAQAVKNLLYLQPSTQAQPPTGLWSRRWPAENNPAGTVDRLRAGPARNPQQIWDRARALLENGDVYREIWIVLGQGMSIASVRAELQSPHPADEMIQIYSLLQSAESTISECSVQLRVFCSP